MMIDVGGECCFLKIYCKESMCSMLKDKLQNCTLYQYEKKYIYLHSGSSETEVNVNKCK
jgi:hypothetical protein